MIMAKPMAGSMPPATDRPLVSQAGIHADEGLEQGHGIGGEEAQGEAADSEQDDGNVGDGMPLTEVAALEGALGSLGVASAGGVDSRLQELDRHGEGDGEGEGALRGHVSRRDSKQGTDDTRADGVGGNRTARANAEAHECKLANRTDGQGRGNVAKNDADAKRKHQATVGVDTKQHARPAHRGPKADQHGLNERDFHLSSL